MNEPFEWHDMVRKSCDSFDEAFELLKSPGMSLILDGWRGILQRKLDQGYELVEPQKVHHLSVYEPANAGKFLGPWVIEYQVTAVIREV